MRPYCAHALPNCWVSFGSFHGSGSAGALQRSSPTGGFANGTPFQPYVPVVAESSTPITRPKLVCRSTGDGFASDALAASTTDPNATTTAATSVAQRTVLRRRRGGRKSRFALIWSPHRCRSRRLQAAHGALNARTF